MDSTSLHEMVFVATPQLSWPEATSTTRADEAAQTDTVRGGGRAHADATRRPRGFRTPKMVGHVEGQVHEGVVASPRDA